MANESSRFLSVLARMYKWATIALGAGIFLFGAGVFAGGVGLIFVDGNAFYAIFGFGVVAAGFYLMHRSVIGILAYIGTFAGTVGWLVQYQGWEIADMWPAIIAPLVGLALVLATLPMVLGFVPLPGNAKNGKKAQSKGIQTSACDPQDRKSPDQKQSEGFLAGISKIPDMISGDKPRQERREPRMKSVSGSAHQYGSTMNGATRHFSA